jgi:hypothetical protein
MCNLHLCTEIEMVELVIRPHIELGCHYCFDEPKGDSNGSLYTHRRLVQAGIQETFHIFTFELLKHLYFQSKSFDSEASVPL